MRACLYRQAAAGPPLIVWSEPDSRWAGRDGVVGLTSDRSGVKTVPPNGIINCVAYLWAKNRLATAENCVLGSHGSRFIIYVSSLMSRAINLNSPLTSTYFVWLVPLSHANIMPSK